MKETFSIRLTAIQAVALIRTLQGQAMTRFYQPFHHRMEVLFTATEDLSEIANTRKFRSELAEFLREQLGRPVIRDSVSFDALVNAEPGEPVPMGTNSKVKS
jgi:hypothetical protein